MLAAVSLVVMLALGVSKRRVATGLGSETLRAESAETFLCASLSAVLLVGLAVNAHAGWWWADPAAALVIAALAVREGREATLAPAPSRRTRFRRRRNEVDSQPAHSTRSYPRWAPLFAPPQVTVNSVNMPAP